MAPLPEQALPPPPVHPSRSVPAAWASHGPKSSRAGFSLLSSFIPASLPVFYKQEEKPDRVLRAGLELSTSMFCLPPHAGPRFPLTVCPSDRVAVFPRAPCVCQHAGP